MAIESLEAALFQEPAPTHAATLQAAHDLIARTSAVADTQVVPLDEEQEEMLARTDVSLFAENGKIIFFTNRRMCREVDEDWMLQLVLSDPDAPKNAMLGLTPVPSGGDLVEQNWLFLVSLLPVVVEIYQPTLALLNGMSSDENVDHLPSFDELTPGEFPTVITPWMYIGPERLNSALRKKLALLDVARTEPLGEGWLLQIIAKYSDTPSRDTIKQLQALTSKGPRYTHTR